MSALAALRAAVAVAAEGIETPSGAAVPALPPNFSALANSGYPRFSTPLGAVQPTPAVVTRGEGPLPAEMALEEGPVREGGLYLNWVLELGTKERNDVCRRLLLSRAEKQVLVKESRRYKQTQSKRIKRNRIVFFARHGHQNLVQPQTKSIS